MNSPVAILCAQSRSIYNELPGVDVFDEKRDAFTFAGGSPVVAHPPCRLWGKLSHFAKPSDAETERFLGVWCVDQVKRNGGVLEHPENSRLWAECALPEPGQSQDEGFTVAFPQWWFGHLGEKMTWFYVHGIRPQDLPEIPLRLDNHERRPVEKLSRWQREATPRALAEWLIETARRTRCAVTA